MYLIVKFDLDVFSKQRSSPQARRVVGVRLPFPGLHGRVCSLTAVSVSSHVSPLVPTGTLFPDSFFSPSVARGSNAHASFFLFCIVFGWYRVSITLANQHERLALSAATSRHVRLLLPRRGFELSGERREGSFCLSAAALQATRCVLARIFFFSQHAVPQYRRFLTNFHAQDDTLSVHYGFSFFPTFSAFSQHLLFRPVLRPNFCCPDPSRVAQAQLLTSEA